MKKRYFITTKKVFLLLISLVVLAALLACGIVAGVPTPTVVPPAITPVLTTPTPAPPTATSTPSYPSFSSEDVLEIPSISVSVGEGTVLFGEGEEPGKLRVEVDGKMPVVDGMFCLCCVDTIRIEPDLQVPLTPFFLDVEVAQFTGGLLVESYEANQLVLSSPISDEATEFILSGPEGATLTKVGQGFMLVEGEAYFLQTKEGPGITVDETPTSGEPANGMFRDDFTEALQAGWEWQNEDPSRWKITSEGWLQIIGEDDSVLAVGTQSNLLCRDAPSDDIQISVHVYAEPKADFQQATLYLYQDGDNFVAINRGYCSLCDTGGNGIYMENKVAGNWTAYNLKNQDTDVFLRLVRRENTITGYYAIEADAWNIMSEFDNPLEDSKICLGVTNADAKGIDADLVGEFDYIEVIQQ
jgi:hypothetical protein